MAFASFLIGAMAALISLPARHTAAVPFLMCPASPSEAAPVMLGEKLSFCGGSTGAVSCCDANDDAELREQFQALMNVSDDDACASAIKDTLCTMRCSPSLSTEKTLSVDLTLARSLPHLLCDSVPPSSSSSTSASAHRGNTQGMCLEKISAGSFINMAAHPDGSNRIFLSSRGKIWIASVPANGSGHTLHIHYGGLPFLDLTQRLAYDDDLARGLRGFAVHPEFSTNGRFFVAYTCDSALPACGGPGDCWVLAPGNRLKPCKYRLVVAEYRAEGGHVTNSKKPSEVRRLCSIGLSEPRTHYSYQHHGGQLLFKLNDSNGYLYLIMGEEFVSSKNKRSPVGKIIRFDIDRASPKAETYAVGVSNPSGCSFDSVRPWHLYCANVNQHQHEQVFLISDKTGRHRSGGSVSLIDVIVDHGSPAGRGRMPSIVGGLVYRGSADPSLVGSYLYMYSSTAWVAVESSAGRYSSARIPNVRCSRSTPLACRGGGGAVIDGRVFSFGEDNNKDAFLLTTGGVYRVVHPDLCEERAPPPPQPPPTWLLFLAVALVYVLYRIYSVIFPGSGGGAVTCFSGCCSNWFVTNNNLYTAQPHAS